MRRLGVLVPFLVAIVFTFFVFGPIGGWLGEGLEGVARASADGGSIMAGDALPLLLGLDAVVLVATFVISYLGGVVVPSGLLHVALGLFFPLTLAAAQARFFELAGSVGGLADSFGGYNFAAVFVLVLVVVQLGVSIARHRYEQRGGQTIPR
ncbi:MAG: hypothetical protein RBS17_04580 [Coriobacteriia bacterium]|nr:hypothetical protein [Coriobacteriia bacterium]